MAVDAWLIAQTTVALVAGALYAYIARVVIGRQLSPDVRSANIAFATWWWTLGAVEFLASAYTLPAAFGYRDLALAVTMINSLVILISVALAALVYFLLYLYTGSRRALWPVVVAYGFLAIGLLYLIAWMQPVGFDEAKGAGELAYVRDLSGAPAIALGLAISGPVLVAALGYGSLYFRTKLRPQRFRIAVVAGSFIAWFGWSAVSAALQLQDRFPRSAWLFAINSALAIGVPLVITTAYHPPRWVRERLADDPLREAA